MFQLEQGCLNFSLLPAALGLFLWIMATSEFKVSLWIMLRNRIYPILSHLLVPTSIIELSNILMTLFKHNCKAFWRFGLICAQINFQKQVTRWISSALVQTPDCIASVSLLFCIVFCSAFFIASVLLPHTVPSLLSHVCLSGLVSIRMQ